MNYFKLLTIFLLSFTMIACSSDEDFNTQEATVEFQSAEIEVKELTSILNLPIVVKGERNGLIKAQHPTPSSNENRHKPNDVH